MEKYDRLKAQGIKEYVETITTLRTQLAQLEQQMDKRPATTRNNEDEVIL